MAVYQPSKYYADDKDVHDILSSPKLSTKALIALCRERGIFLSEEAPREELVHYASKLPFSWTQIQQVMGAVQREDKEEKITTCKIAVEATVDEVRQAIEQVRDIRKEPRSEQYSITQGRDGKIKIKVNYTEPDFQRARLIQRRQKGDQYEVRHSQNERTDEIITQIIEELTPANSEQKPVRRTIDLSGVKNHEHRTQFFVNLIGEMEGFQLREVRDLKVDHLENDPAAPGVSEEDEAKEKIEREQLRSLVRKVALSGDNILISPQYQHLAKDGFFISKAVWTSVETLGAGRLFEFEAEFRDAANATKFAYQIRGVYNRNQDGEIEKTKSELSEAEKGVLRDCLETAAYGAVEKVNAMPAATS